MVGGTTAGATIDVGTTVGGTTDRATIGVGTTVGGITGRATIDAYITVGGTTDRATIIDRATIGAHASAFTFISDIGQSDLAIVGFTTMALSRQRSSIAVDLRLPNFNLPLSSLANSPSRQNETAELT